MTYLQVPDRSSVSLDITLVGNRYIVSGGLARGWVVGVLGGTRAVGNIISYTLPTVARGVTARSRAEISQTIGSSLINYTATPYK